MIRSLAILSLSLALLSFAVRPPQKIRIFLAGDSTMAGKTAKAFPETGWGTPFKTFWDSTVEVVNEAQNGRSTKSFLREGRWDRITDALQPGDYVFIQFGHNDEVPSKKSYIIPDSFCILLKKFIADTREKKAVPVLFTPVSRRQFDSTGKALETHAYSPLVRKVAAETGVAFIDLDKESIALYASMGAENSKLLFLHLAAGEHPHYPDGKEDNTHFNELGARKIAELVFAKLKTIAPELMQRMDGKR